jgi:hypothetical protein
MKSKQQWIVKTVAGVTLSVAGLILAAQADARPPVSGGSTVTRTGPAGNTATRQTSVATNGQGGYTASSTLTGPKGNTATRQQSGSYNPATKTYTRSATTTGPNGKSATQSRTVTVTPPQY